MDYEQLPRAALVRMLQEHDAALADAGKNGIVMSYTGRAAPGRSSARSSRSCIVLSRKYPLERKPPSQRMRSGTVKTFLRWSRSINIVVKLIL